MHSMNRRTGPGAQQMAINKCRRWSAIELGAMRLVVSSLVLAAAHSTAHAVNKCRDSQGRIVYSDAPCPSGVKAEAMEWQPSANTNVMNAAGSSSTTRRALPLPDLSGLPLQRLKKIMAVLDDVGSTSAMCRSALNQAIPTSKAIARCEEFSARSGWLRSITEAMDHLAADKQFAKANFDQMADALQQVMDAGKTLKQLSLTQGERVKELDREIRETEMERDRALKARSPQGAR